MKKSIISALLLVFAVGFAQAADQTWGGGGTGNNTAWTTSGNWVGGAMPGSTATTTNTDIATIPATGTNPAIGISGTATQYLGAISLTSAANRALGASGTTGGSLTLQLNGATVNGVANTILRASNTGTFTLQINNGQGTPNTLSLALGNATNNIINIDSSGGINIGVAITGASKNLTLNGSGMTPGILTFSGAGANTYSGTTTVNAGELDLNKTAGINAIAGALVAGDGTGAADTAVVKLLASNQINDASGVTVNSDGKFNIGAFSDSVGVVTLAGGSIAGTTGILSGSSYDMRSGSVGAKLGGSGALTKTTGGTVVLTGANTYTGDTNINDGVLQVDGSTASNTFVNSGGTLAGAGTIFGAVTNNGGTVAPGDSPGTLIVNSFTQNSGTLLIDIAGLSMFSMLDVNGLATLGGILNPMLDGYTPNDGDQFAFLLYGSRSGTFSSILGTPFAGGHWEITYNDNPGAGNGPGGGGTAILMAQMNSAPGVPDQGSTLALLGLSLLGLVICRRQFAPKRA